MQNLQVLIMCFFISIGVSCAFLLLTKLLVDHEKEKLKSFLTGLNFKDIEVAKISKLNKHELYSLGKMIR